MLALTAAGPTLRAPTIAIQTAPMPIYAFECASCGHSFDRLQRLSDADPTHCPECAAEGIFRQLTAPQFRLSGSGWYETDFKGEGDKKRNLAGEGGAPKPASTGETATAGKPDAKADSRTATSPGTSGAGKNDSGSKDAAAKPAAVKPTPASTNQ